MNCQEFKIKDLIGKYLFNELTIGNTVFPRGYKIQEKDVPLFKQAYIETMFAAEMEEGDCDASAALGQIAAKLCGKNTAYSITENGICKIISTIDGVFAANEDRISKFNRHGNFFILNTISPYIVVEKDSVIAELELNLPLIPQEKVDELLMSLSGNTELLSIHDISAKKVGLIYTRLTNDKKETKHFTGIVKRLVNDFPKMDLKFEHEYQSAHTSEDIANVLQRALKENNDVLFVLPAQQTRCPHDVIIKALNSVVDDIVCSYLPQVNAGDFIIASKSGKRIIVIPYNYDNVDSSYAVRYMRQALVNDKLNAYDFDHPQNFVLSKTQKIVAEEQNHYISANNTNNKSQAQIAAIVLAAGIGARCGRNKLLTPINGEPLFLKALKAAVKSKASPVFLITGHQAEEMEDYIDDIDVNVVRNTSYRSGIKTSIEAGIKSIPSFCDGVMILPADMPNISKEYINKMIEMYKKGDNKQLILSEYKNKKCNPIIWGKDFYAYADIVPENAELRTIFAPFADYTKVFKVKNSDDVLDVTYPADIEKLQKEATK